MKTSKISGGGAVMKEKDWGKERGGKGRENRAEKSN